MRTVVLGLDFLDERVVDIVTSVTGVHLVAWTWDGTVDTAKVGRTGTDVNDQGVVDHVKSVSNSERLRDDHGRVNGACGSVKDGRLVNVTCLGWSTNNSDDTVVVLWIGKADEVGDKVSNVLSVFGGVLDHTELKRSVQIERQAVLQSLVSEENVSLEEVSSNRVLGGTNDRQLFDFVAV